MHQCSLFDADKFEIVVESRHADDAGNTENVFLSISLFKYSKVHNLTPGQLKKRIVDYIDIATDKIDEKHYKKEEDPQYFKSKKTGRGPFKKGWQVHCAKCIVKK